MSGVLIGFAIIATVILIGYITGRAGVLGEHAPFVISRFTFFVLSPCLLFTVLADADVHELFSSLLVVSAISALLVCFIFLGIALLLFKRRLPEAVIGALSSGYVNANNIGIPVAVYVLGNTAYSAPVILFQLLVLAPIALTVLDISTNGRGSVWRTLLSPLRNPLIIGSALGAIVAITGLEIPDAVMEPFRIVGAAAVPLVLIGFGMSLHGQRPMAPGSGRRDVVLATVLKLGVQPLIAWLLGQFVFHLDAEHLFAVVVLATLPTAQNIFVYAQRYGRGQVVARDTILITTVGAVPVLVLIAALLT